MARGTVTIQGIDQLIRNLQQLQLQIKVDTPTALIKAADRFRDDAILTLQSRLGQSSGRRWGHSLSQKAITDKSSWEKTYPSWNKVILTSTSEHSAIVELGGTKRIDVDTYSNGAWAWPIGLSQGSVEWYSKQFQLQSGYHYFATTINNPYTINGMVNEISKVLARSVRSACL